MMGDERGSPGEFVSVDETTTRVIAERRQAFLLALEEKLRGLSTPKDVMTAAVEVLTEHLAVSQAGYAVVDRGGQYAVVGEASASGRASSTSPSYYRIDDYGPVLAQAVRGAGVVVEDISSDPRLAMPATRVDGPIRALVVEPIVKEGRTEGYLYAAHSEPRRWTEAELALIRDAAERTWASVERARAEEALRQSEERLAEVLTAARMAAWTWDPISDHTIASDTASDVFGLLPGESLESSAQGFQLVHPDDVERHRTLVQRAGERGESWHSEFRIIRPRDGQIAWLEERATAAREADTGLVRMTGLVWDITERKQAEEHRREAARALERQLRIFDTTLSSINDFAYIFDKQGRFCYSNQPLLDLLEITLDEIIGKTFFDLPYPHDLAERLQRQIQQVFDTRQTVTDETSYISPQGIAGYYEYIFNPVIVADGSVEFVAGSTRDITARNQAEEVLRESEERFRSFAENSVDGLWIADAATRRLTYLSPAFDRIWGLPREMILGDLSRWEALVHPEDRTSALGAISRVIDGETVVSEHRIIRRADRVVRWIRDMGFPIRDETGVVLQIAGIAQDITELRNLEQAREEFLSSAAHDLKTPLTSIRGHTQLAQRWLARHGGVDVTPVLDALAQIMKGTDAMLGLIGELADVTRLDMGGALDLHPQPIDLIALVRDSIAAQQSATSSPIELEAAAPELVARVDAARIARVVDNLLSNAIKYSPDGETITVRVARDAGVPVSGSCAVIAVADRGLGIPAADLPYLFDRFMRASNVMGRIEGTGIGLASVRGIVEAHGGTVEVESREGIGSTFTVRLPLEAL